MKQKSLEADDLKVAIIFLRTLRGWNQTQFAEAAGIDKGQLSLYENGHRAPSARTLKKLLTVAGVSEPTFQALLAFIRMARAGQGIGIAESAEGGSRVARVVSGAMESARAKVLASRTVAHVPALSPSEARQEAEALWERLRSFSPSERLVLVAGGREYQSWALCELLCIESERAAACDASRAVELAELSLRVAERVSGDQWPLRIQGYAWAHLGNARRVASNLPGADSAFRRARELWEAGAAADPGWLSEAQVLSLEASLRRAQRRFPESLELLERALAGAPPSLAGSIGLKLATTLQLMGEYARAIGTLERTAPLVEEGADPRLLFALRFNLAANLDHLGRHQEAAELLPEVREMAAQLRNELDLIRVHWLEGRVAAGQGRREEAVETFARVRAEFVARGIGYNAALVSMELAVLYLEEGWTGEVKTLAREMAPIFQAQGVHREALAALRLFCDAAEREAVTLEMARRLVHYLERARLDPELRFAASLGATP